MYLFKSIHLYYIIHLKKEVLNMTKIITFGLQKGGVSKTTKTEIMSYLFSKDNKKVLAVDFDSQVNLTELLTNEPANNFINNSIFEAIAFRDYKKPHEYKKKVNDNL